MVFYIHSIEKLVSWFSYNNCVIKKADYLFWLQRSMLLTLFSLASVFTEDLRFKSVPTQRKKNKLDLNH